MSGFEHISPGSKWQPSSIEINAMKDVARAYQGGAGVTPPGGVQAGWNLQPTCVRVINLTGRNIDRYTAFKLGGARWVLSGDFELPTAIFSLIAPDAVERSNAIVQQPLKTNEIGYAAIAGPSLVKVTGDGLTIDRWGLPNADGVLVPGDVIGTVHFTQDRPNGGGVVMALVDYQKAVVTTLTPSINLVLSPAGGIPAVTKPTSTFVWGSALCFIIQNNGNVAGNQLLVQNIGPAIAEGAVVIAIKRDALWFVSCGCGVPDPDPDPDPDPEPPI